MSATNFFPGGPLNQCVVEWRIEGALDGSTPAPGLEVSGNIITQHPQSPEQPFIINVPGSAGLFNPDVRGGTQSSADRYLQWIRIAPATFPVPITFQMQIVDASRAVPALGDRIVIERIHVGPFLAPALYGAQFIFVPQGAVVRVLGIPVPPPGQRHVVQFGIRAATSAVDDSNLHYANCCLATSA